MDSRAKGRAVVVPSGKGVQQTFRQTSKIPGVSRKRFFRTSVRSHPDADAAGHAARPANLQDDPSFLLGPVVSILRRVDPFRPDTQHSSGRVAGQDGHRGDAVLRIEPRRGTRPGRARSGGLNVREVDVEVLVGLGESVVEYGKAEGGVGLARRVEDQATLRHRGEVLPRCCAAGCGCVRQPGVVATRTIESLDVKRYGLDLLGNHQMAGSWSKLVNSQRFHFCHSEARPARTSDRGDSVMTFPSFFCSFGFFFFVVTVTLPHW